MLEYNTRYEYTQRLDTLYIYIHNKNFFKHFFLFFVIPKKLEN